MRRCTSPEEQCLQSSPSSFHMTSLLCSFINVGQATIYLPHCGAHIKTSLFKVRIGRACANWPHQSLCGPAATVRNATLQQMPWPSAQSKHCVFHKAPIFQQNKDLKKRQRLEYSMSRTLDSYHHFDQCYVTAAIKACKRSHSGVLPTHLHGSLFHHPLSCCQSLT